MTIEEEIWNEFDILCSNHNSPDFSIVNDYGKIARIDKAQHIWVPNGQVAADELINKVLTGEKKWDNIVDDLPKRIVTEFHEPEFRKLNKLLLSIFHTQEHAVDYLKIKRFPTGICCIRCGGSVYHMSTGEYKCPSCNYKFAEKTKTIFSHTKLDLIKWYGAIVILTSKNKVSTHKLAEILRLTQKTTYYMARKVKQNIHDPFLREINHGIFEYKP